MEELVDSVISSGIKKGEMADRLETAWISSSQKGDAAAFNQLVLKWERPIYNLTLRMLQNTEEAAEITQEVFLSAYKNIKRFRLEARFATWLYRIAANQCISRLRQRPPGLHISLDDERGEFSLGRDIPVPAGHEDAFLKEESRRQVLKALASLPEEQRLVVDLKFFQEMTFEEISEVLEVPLSTIKTRLYSALALLKNKLGRAAI
jgi:RNA polymerase sigma-70 factor, ECF subfamily